MFEQSQSRNRRSRANATGMREGLPVQTESVRQPSSLRPESLTTHRVVVPFLDIAPFTTAVASPFPRAGWSPVDYVLYCTVFVFYCPPSIDIPYLSFFFF